MMIFYSLLAFVAGVTVVISRIINANLSKQAGIFQSTFFNYATGLFLSTIFMFLTKEFTQLSTNSFNHVPFYAYLGGLLGMVVVILSNYITPKISAFYLTLFVFIGQLLMGLLIDWFSLHILSIGKIIGGVLVFVGLTYNLCIDKKCLNSKST